jgi:hypothetical protein
MKDEELYELFDEMARGIMRGGRSMVVYMKANTMRNVWQEIRRRGLPDPKFPEDKQDEEDLEILRTIGSGFVNSTVGEC